MNKLMHLTTLNHCLLLPANRCPALDTTFAKINSTDTQFGVTVNISCLPGYRISGQSTATVHCNSTGQWSLNAACLRMLRSLQREAIAMFW